MDRRGPRDRACVTCRRIRKGCDRAFPCSRCVAAGKTCPGPSAETNRIYVYANSKKEIPLRDTQVVSTLAQWQPNAFESPSPGELSCGDNRLVPNLEDLAFGYYLKSLSSQGALSLVIQRPFQDLFTTSHVKSPLNSPLRYCTESYALLAYADHVGVPEVKGKAIKAYGAALKAVRPLLQDPSQIGSDETLMSIWIMGLIQRKLEVSSGNPADGLNSHFNGLSAVLRLHRNSDDDQSRKLFTCLLDYLILICMGQSQPLPAFSEDDIQIFPSLLEGPPPDCLSYIGAQIPELRYRARGIYENSIPEDGGQKLALVQDCFRVDLELGRWFLGLPAEVRTPVIVPNFRAMVGNGARKSWPNYRHIYVTRQDQMLINRSRIYRLYCLAVVIGCTKQAEEPLNLLTAHHSIQAQLRIRDVADDLCASLPIIADEGGVSTGPVPLISQPQIPGQRMRTSEILSSLSIAKEVQCIPYYQRKWLEDYLQFIIERSSTSQGVTTKAAQPERVREICIG